jgi:TolB protein
MTLRLRRFLTLVALWSFIPGALLAQGDTTTRTGVRIGLSYDLNARPGIAVLPVRGGERPITDSVRAMLQRDFDNGDRITIVGFNEADLPLVSGTPNYEVFERLNVHGIVQASLTPGGALHIALYDVREKAVAGVDNFPLSSNVFSPAWRQGIHRAADEVERWATGVQGISATRIAFVRNDQIWQVDSDGENATPVRGTAGGRSPAWHPSGQHLAFNVLTDAGSQIALHDVLSGSTRRLTSTTSGTSGSPMFSPDGMTLFYSFGLDRGSDVWALDPFRGGRPRRVTAGGGSENISPSFSPDGRRFAFTSGRLINPEVYIADVDGTNVDLLITSGTGDQSYRSNPAWSPDGRQIAFQSMVDGRFQLMVISLQNRAVKPLTSESQNEDPSWAPDGRHIVFTSRRSGSDQLWVLDAESGRSRQLTRGSGAAKHGAWSPALKGGSAPTGTLITPDRRER